MTSEALEKKIQCGETSRVQFKQQFSSQKEIAADMVLLLITRVVISIQISQ